MKRLRLLLAAAAVAFLALVGFAHPAGAQEKVSITEANEHCIKLLEKGNDVEDCQKSPNPLLPETNAADSNSTSLITRNFWYSLKKSRNTRC